MSSRTPSDQRVETPEERVERLSRLQNEFVAMVAHELREPLTSCIGYAELLIAHFDDLSKAEREEALRTISRTGRRMARLIEDVLDVARIEAGELTYVMEPVDLNALITEVLEEHGRLVEGVEIRSEPGEVPLIHGDHGRLRQVLLNLVSNAVKFSPEGGAVRVSTDHLDGRVLLSVADEGIGIDPRDMPRLFGRFARIEQPGLAQRIPGTGLGLYICKRIVEGHEGRIWAESEPGRGTTFFVALRPAT